MIYTTFAEVYDQLMDQSLYQRWRDYVVKRVKPSHQPLLELAGGSGFLAVLLAQSGYQVTDFDLSEEMLTGRGKSRCCRGRINPASRRYA